MVAPVGLTSSSQLSSTRELTPADKVKRELLYVPRFPAALVYRIFERTVNLNDPLLKDLKLGAVKAINTYEWVLNVQNSPTLLALRGEVHRVEGRWNEAFSDFDAAAKRLPNWDYPLGRRGAVLFEMYKEERALVDLTRAHAMNPEDAFILTYIGDCYRGLRDYKTAISYFTKALNIDPKNLRSLLGRTESHIVLENYKDAETDCKKALEIDPDDAFAHSQMAKICYANRKWSHALEYLNKSMQTPPFSVRDLMTRATIHLSRRDLDAAFADYDRALYYANKRIEENPNLAFNWERRADLYSELNLPEHAASDIHKALELSPNDPYIKQFLNLSSLPLSILQQDRFQAYTEALRKKLGPPTSQAPA